MIVAIVSAVFSFIPAIIVGKNLAVGWGILCYFISLIAGFIGFYIGKFLNEFVGDRFIITNGGFLNLLMEKFDALYGPQITGFLIGLFIPSLLLSNGITKSKSNTAQTAKRIKTEVAEAVDSVNTFDFMIPVKGGEFFFYEEGKGLSPEYSKYSNLKLKVEDFAISKVPVSAALYSKFTGYKFSEEYEKKAPFDNRGFTWYGAIVFCNKLSKLHKLTPCYSINGSTNPDDWGEIPHTYRSENFTWDTVKCDFSANGYRMPTVAEWIYAFCASEKYNPDVTGIPYKYPNYLGISKPCDTSKGYENELLWNWETSDFSVFANDNTAPNMGDARLCIGSKFNEYNKYKSIRKSSEANYTFQPIDNYQTSLRLVRTLSEKERNLAFKHHKDFDISDYGINMVFVEGGEFNCGGSNDNELPLHTATVKDFYMSSTMVTWAISPEMRISYDDFRNKKNEKFVKTFEFVEVFQFCNYLSVMSNLEPCYDFSNYDRKEPHIIFNEHANGYRLPTEEEWEYAAKGGKNKDSYRWSGSDNIEEVAWYDGNKENNKELLVGLKKANSIGLYDMSGLDDEIVWSNYKTGNVISDLYENFESKGYGSIDIRFVTRGGDIDRSYKDLSITRRKIEHIINTTGGAIRLVRNK